MAQRLNLKLAGLYTNPNSYSEAPEGALATAANIVIDRPSVAESRRGQVQFNPALAGDVKQLMQFQDNLVVQYGGLSTIAYDDGAGLWVDFDGDYSAPDGYKMRWVEANKNLYFTTSFGVKKIDALDLPIKTAGAPQGLNGEAYVNGAGNAIPDTTNVAYRIVWGYDDANGNRILGAPSQRVVVSNNAGSTQLVAFNSYIPSGITSAWFYQLYRSAPSADLATQPDDELQLVLSGNPTGTELTAGVVSLSDNLPDALRGTSLYTNSTQEGAESANAQPPWCVDVELYKGHTFFANTRQKHALTLQMIGVGTPSFGVLATTGDITTGSAVVPSIASTTNIRPGMRVKGTGIPAGAKVKTVDSGVQVTLTANATATTVGVALQFCDTLTISGVEYFGSASGVMVDGEFRIDTSGTPSENIQNTVNNLIIAINGSTQNTASAQPVYAYYLSTVEQFPGKFLIQERVVNSVDGEPFEVLSTYGDAFTPQIPGLRLITNVAVGNPTVITSANHGFATGDLVLLTVPGAVPGFSGAYAVTVTGTNTFTVAVNTTTGATYGTAKSLTQVVESDNEERLNRVAFSKLQQPEAVPVLNYIDCGSAVFPIRRIAAQGESLFIFKDDGVFRITGDDKNSFRSSAFDNTTVIYGPETLAKCGNQLFFFSTKGVSVCSESGVALASDPIEDQLLPLLELTEFTLYAFGVGYESDKRYHLFVQASNEDENATQAFCYSLHTTAWTRWVMPRTCGIVNKADNKLYMGGSNQQVYVERKDYASTDYADDQYTVSIVSSLDGTLTLASTTNLAVGDTIQQGSAESVITAVPNSTVITVQDTTVEWTAGAATVYRPIDAALEWIPQPAGNPGLLKHWREITILLRSADFSALTVGFATNFTESAEYTLITPLLGNTWGSFPWGGVAWGQFSAAKQPQRTFVPRNSSRAHWLTISLDLNRAFNKLDVEGISLIYDVISERFK